MKLKPKVIAQLKRKVARIHELEVGRVSHNRIHKNKKAYSRKKYKGRIIIEY